VIAVDTSALMAIVLNEPQASSCIAVLEAEQDVLISAGTFAEAMIVATVRNVGAEMESLILQLGFDIVPLTGSATMRFAQIYAKWGKGMNPAGLNFGDCFAYDVAKQNDCSLLYVGEDFSRTDLKAAGVGSKASGGP
jgi:ribonuclease VapC